MTPLCEIAKRCATDKGGYHHLAGDTCHTYTEVYWEMFNGKQDQIRSLLEVGIHYGASLRMWHDFFPNAQIYGMDSNYSTLINNGRFHCKGVDQGNREELLLRMSEWGNRQFDVIVDDGSHEIAHQVITANALLPFVAPKGVYIIEDITYDCTPETVTDLIVTPPGFQKRVFMCRTGIGKAHCDPSCFNCHGSHNEQLVVYYRE
jgi:hypothetical protein